MRRYRLSTARVFRIRLGLHCFSILSLFGMLGWTIAVGRIETAFTQNSTVTVVNAASFATDALAPDSLAAAFGSFMTTGGQTFTASSTPLPTTLGGVSVTANGIVCSLIAAGPGQINFVLPANLPDGSNLLVVTNSDNSTRLGSMNIQRAAPGIFTARSTGVGTAAALATSDGATFLPAANPDGSEREISAGTKDNPNYLVLFVTGLRNAAAINPNDGNGVAEAVNASIQGVPTTVMYAGRSGTFAGLDQVNLIIPPELSGLGSVRVRLTIAWRVSNVPVVRIGGQPPAIRATQINPEAGVFGVLSINDQIQGSGDGSGRTYFFDAYRYSTTTANTSVAVDLRSAQFDAAVVIVQQRTDGSLTFIASDDQTGGLGNGIEENNNALLMTVLRDPGDYLIFTTSADREPNATGSYQLNLTTSVISKIEYGATSNDATITNTDMVTSAGDRFDAFWFTGSAGDVVQIRMTSTVFDSFLILNADNGDLIEYDDNSGGGTLGRDSLLTKSLAQSGNYVLIATPFEPGRTGAYTLSVSKLNSAMAFNDEAQAPAPGRALTTDRSLRQMQFDRFASRRIVATAGSEQ